jgi:precorrin-6B methylase 1
VAEVSAGVGICKTAAVEQSFALVEITETARRVLMLLDDARSAEEIAAELRRRGLQVEAAEFPFAEQLRGAVGVSSILHP